MASVYALKPRFQALIRPGVVRLAAAGVTANQLTVGAMVISLAASAGLIWSTPDTWAFVLLAPLLLLRMALNAADGMLAREHGQASALGHYLNEIGDVVSDIALIAPFAFLPVFEPIWVAAAAALSALTEFAGVLAQKAGGTRRYDGPMGKSDRAAALAGLGLWLASGLPLTGIEFAMPVLCILLLWTLVNRVRGGLRARPEAGR